MPEAFVPSLDLDAARCGLTERIQGFVRALRSTEAQPGAAPALMARHFCLDGLDPGSLPLASERLSPLITEAQLFGLGPAAPAPEIPFELRLLAYGIKPLALLHAPELELTSWVSWAQRRGCTALLSSHQWEPRTDLGKGGYSNLSGDQRPAQAGSGAWRSLLVSADEDRAILGWLCLHFGWDSFLGQLLGYPSCCAAAFTERWTAAVEGHQGDLAPLTLAASGPPPYDWRLNVFARYFGASVIGHFPCRFECSASHESAERVARGLGWFEAGYLDGARELMRSPVLYTETMGVALLRGACVSEQDGEARVDLDPRSLLLSDAGSPLSRALLDGQSVVAQSGEAGFWVGATRFDGHLVWFT